MKQYLITTLTLFLLFLWQPKVSTAQNTDETFDFHYVYAKAKMDSAIALSAIAEKGVSFDSLILIIEQSSVLVEEAMKHHQKCRKLSPDLGGPLDDFVLEADTYDEEFDISPIDKVNSMATKTDSINVETPKKDNY